MFADEFLNILFIFLSFDNNRPASTIFDGRHSLTVWFPVMGMLLDINLWYLMFVAFLSLFFPCDVFLYVLVFVGGRIKYMT